jgi:hypothetical protein
MIRSPNARTFSTLFLLVALPGAHAAAASDVPSVGSADSILIVPAPPDSTFGTRRLFVRLPEGYDPARRYPVVYALDGQDLFAATTSSHDTDWGLDDLLDARPPGIEPLIVVGIESSPRSTLEHSLPGSADDANGDVFARYIARTVKPFVDTRWATRRERQGTVVMGQGPGAVLAVYAAWALADTFGGAIALDLPQIDVRWMGPPPQKLRPRIWIEQAGGDSGGPSTADLLALMRKHGDVQYVVGSAQAPRLVLVAAGLRAVLPSGN